MSGRWRVFLRKLVGVEVPAGFAGRLEADERVLAVGAVDEGGHLVATSLGLWMPEGAADRRVGWHLISKATWRDGALVVIEAEQVETVRGAAVLADRPARRFPLSAAGRLPEAVHNRVTGSIKSRHHRQLPGGGAWFVQRKVPGQDGMLLQVRPDPGTDPAAVRAVVEQVTSRVDGLRDRDDQP